MTAPPRDIVQTVRAELAVPGRYHLRIPAAHRSLIAQFWAWVSAHWDQFWSAFWHRFGIGPAGLSVVGDAMVACCALLIAGAAAHLLLRVEFERAARSRSIPLTAPRNAQSYAVAAAQAASTGEYTRAVRLLFIAAVTLLDLRGVVRDDRGATINELRRELGGRDALLEASFVDLARVYTSAAYAEVPLDANAWERAQAAYARLKERAVA